MTDERKMNCREVFKRLDDYVDRELSPNERDGVHEHLEKCAHCAAEHDFEESFISCVREKLRRIEAPTELRDRIAASLSGDDSS